MGNIFSGGIPTLSTSPVLYKLYVHSELSYGTCLSSQKNILHFVQSVVDEGKPLHRYLTKLPPKMKIKFYV